MLNNLKECTFDEVKHLIPSESFYHSTNDRLFLLSESHLTLSEHLNLDELFNDYCAIIIQGDLTAKNIYNEETDGSSGLIVLGHLIADNIVVGGQEIFVNKNLTVNELYWGDYNHGELVVNGKIKAKVFMATDYGFDNERFIDGDNVNIKHLFCEYNDDEEYFFEKVCSIFDENAINQDEINWQYVINKDVIFDYLQNGQSVINDDKTIKAKFKKLTTTMFFENDEFSVQNLKIIQDNFHYMIDECDEDWRCATFWLDDNVRWYLVKNKTYPQFLLNINGEDFGIFIEFINDDEIVSVDLSRDFSYDNVEPLDKTKHKKEYKFFEKYWKMGLKDFTKAIQTLKKFVTKVNKESFFDILHHEDIQNIYQKNKDKNGILHIRGHQFKMTENRISMTDYVDDTWVNYEWREDFGRVVVGVNCDENESIVQTEKHFCDAQHYKIAAELFSELKMNLVLYDFYK